jgi:hypothetical protein
MKNDDSDWDVALLAAAVIAVVVLAVFMIVWGQS